MDPEEVKDWILPPDYDHVSSEAKHLVSESDTNGVRFEFFMLCAKIILIL